MHKTNLRRSAKSAGTKMHTSNSLRRSETADRCLQMKADKMHKTNLRRSAKSAGTKMHTSNSLRRSETADRCLQMKADKMHKTNLRQSAKSAGHNAPFEVADELRSEIIFTLRTHLHLLQFLRCFKILINRFQVPPEISQ
jgi:hypothetical protein